MRHERLGAAAAHRWPLTVALMAALGGCGGSGGSGKKVGKELEKIASTARTTSLVAAQWSQGRVPDVYAAQMACLVDRQLDQERRRPVWRQAAPDVGPPALALIDGTAALARRLAAAVEGGNLGGAATLASEGADLAGRADQLRRQAGGS